MQKRDSEFMQAALEQSYKAFKIGEVPVGAVLVYKEEIIAKGYNTTIKNHDASSHAEINVIRAASKIIGNYRLTNSKLYVTLEPCIMCLGAAVNARVQEIIFAAEDKRFGALLNHKILEIADLNHKVAFRQGPLKLES